MPCPAGDRVGENLLTGNYLQFPHRNTAGFCKQPGYEKGVFVGGHILDHLVHPTAHSRPGTAVPSGHPGSVRQPRVCKRASQIQVRPHQRQAPDSAVHPIAVSCSQLRPEVAFPSGYIVDGDHSRQGEVSPGIDVRTGDFYAVNSPVQALPFRRRTETLNPVAGSLFDGQRNISTRQHEKRCQKESMHDISLHLF